jgi:hypothetical protein
MDHRAWQPKQPLDAAGFREVIRLMTHRVRTNDEDVYKPGVYRDICDPVCGTRGMPLAPAEARSILPGLRRRADTATRPQQMRDRVTMRYSTAVMAAAALAMFGISSSARAEGVGAEANYGHANGSWGTELGAGYAMDIAGFSLTPGAGVYLRDGGARVYGRVEATYALPTSLTIGAGVRISGDAPRPYATLAMPLLPKFQIKGNLGPKYVSVGLRLGY